MVDDKRAIYYRASGQLSTAAMSDVLEAAKPLHDSFAGKPHFIVADMRGLAPLSPEAAGVLMAIIRYGREHAWPSAPISPIRASSDCRRTAWHARLRPEILERGESSRRTQDELTRFTPGEPVTPAGT